MADPQQLAALMAAMGKRSGMSKPGIPNMPMPMPMGVPPAPAPVMSQPDMNPAHPSMPGNREPYNIENFDGDPNAEPSDEEMLEKVRDGMGGMENQVTGQDLEADKQAVLAAPTDGNISAFIDHWGEDELPEEMRNSNPDAPDYATGDE